MISRVDIHCHVLAGLDDGPATLAEAVEMCRIARHDGTGVIAATAHLGEKWPASTPDRIRSATAQLRDSLRETSLELIVYPSAEIMVRPDLEQAWSCDQLLGAADRPEYLLVELPEGAFLDLADLVAGLRRLGVRPILAHPERHPELLHESGIAENLARLGCLMQINATSIADPPTARDAKALQSWVRRGLVHFVASDGHSPTRRPPRMAKAYDRVAHWAGPHVADRLCCLNGLSVCEGRPIRVPPPSPVPRRPFWRLWK